MQEIKGMQSLIKELSKLNESLKHIVRIMTQNQQDRKSKEARKNDKANSNLRNPNSS